MFEILEAYLGKRFSPSEKDIALIRSVFQPRQLKKSEFLYHAGEIARYEAFVTKGLLRRYVIDKKGAEHIVQFAPENWWVRDEKGFTYNQPSDFFIDAIEDSFVLLIDKQGHYNLIEKIPGYGTSFQAGLQNNIAAKDKRILHSLTATAEERYADYLKTYPLIARRVPQHMLASYLGITPETLSRIRRRATKK